MHAKLVALCKTYLGPAAESFLERMYKIYLKAEASAVGPAHMKELAEGVAVSAIRMMTADKANELSKKIMALR